jgi:hypothetical protein
MNILKQKLIKEIPIKATLEPRWDEIIPPRV